MGQEPYVVALHVLGTDVDVHVTGVDAEGTAEAIRERWHLSLRADEPDGTGAERDAAKVPDTRKIVEAAVTAPDEDQTPWARAETVVRDQDVRRMLQRLTQTITYSAIGARSGEVLMLHAAALADRGTGATAGFVAEGNTGKTTLCRTLGPGRAYVTDETLAVRRDGTVVPYLKPLSVRRPDWAGVKDEQAPGSLGLQAPSVEPWLAGLVILRREPEHEGPVLVEDLDLLDAIIELTPQSSAFMKTEGPLHWLADVLARTGGLRRVTYSEVADLEPLLDELCSRRSPW